MTGRIKSRRRAAIETSGLSCWVALVALFFLWQAIGYRGVISWLGEWQFDTFGVYYPTLTYVLIVVVLAAPGLLLFLKPRTQSEREGPAAATLRSSRSFERVLLGISAAFGVAMLLALLTIFGLPDDKGAVQTIALDQPVEAAPIEGPTTISGHILYANTALMDENLLVTRRATHFVPIATSDADRNLRYFVELDASSPRPSHQATSVTGILKYNGLPGEIVRLFRHAGFGVDVPNYVLFSNQAAMRWPHFILAAEMTLGALLFLALYFWQRRNVRKLSEANFDLVPR